MGVAHTPNIDLVLAKAKDGAPLEEYEARALADAYIAAREFVDQIEATVEKGMGR